MLRFQRLLWGSITLSSAACSLALKTDPQCQTNADCEARGKDFAGAVCENEICVSGDPAWNCVGHVKWPAPQTGEVEFKVRIVEILSLQPPPGLMVKACAKVDVSCLAPLSGPASPGTDGKVAFTLPSGFDGYFEIRSDTTVPSYLSLVEPIVESREHPAEIELLTPTNFEILTKTLGFAADPQRGTLVILARDCLGNPSAGLTFSSDANDDRTNAFYLAGGLPSRTAQATDAAGSGGFINVPVGFSTVIDKRVDTGQTVGTTSLQIRAGNLTYIDLPPTPLGNK